MIKPNYEKEAQRVFELLFKDRSIKGHFYARWLRFYKRYCTQEKYAHQRINLIRWKYKEPQCPECHKRSMVKTVCRKGRGIKYLCNNVGNHESNKRKEFGVYSGSNFQSRKWATSKLFIASFYFAHSKKISAHALAKALKVNNETVCGQIVKIWKSHIKKPDSSSGTPSRSVGREQIATFKVLRLLLTDPKMVS